jgi:hypothetical protein
MFCFKEVIISIGSIPALSARTYGQSSFGHFEEIFGQFQKAAAANCAFQAR